MYKNVQNYKKYDDLHGPRARKGTTTLTSDINFIPTATMSPKLEKNENYTTIMPIRTSML